MPIVLGTLQPDQTNPAGAIIQESSIVRSKACGRTEVSRWNKANIRGRRKRRDAGIPRTRSGLALPEDSARTAIPTCKANRNQTVPETSKTGQVAACDWADVKALASHNRALVGGR